MVRIAFDHQIVSTQQYGGVSRYICELARHMASTHEQDVSIVSPLYVNQYLKQMCNTSVKVFGFPVARIPKTSLILSTLNSILAFPLLKLLNPNIVHETYYTKTRFRPKKAKILLTVYDMIHELFPGEFRAGDPTHSKKAAAVARADHVICISRHTQKDLINLMGVSPEKTSVVHLGFTLTSKHEQTSQMITNSPYLLYVGNRRGYKNFDALLTAVASSNLLARDFRIICFGGGDLRKDEQQLIARLGFASDSVCQVSGSDALLAGLYRHATAFVYPSLYEGFGIPPLEAMSFNCPVACSNSGSIPEVVGDAGAYFNPTNIDSIRDTIEKVILNEAYRNLLVAAGQIRVKLFSWERCAAETLEVYKKVLG